MHADFRNTMIKKLKLKLNDDFIRHGTWMLLASGLASFFNLLYQVYMSRNLSTVDFGILNSLIALLLIISVPAGTLQTAITKFTAGFHAHNHWEKIKMFLSKLTKRVLLFGILFFLIIVLGSRYIASFFQIPDSALVVIIAVLMLLSVILPLALGGLQGLQMFGWLGLSGIMGSGLKLVLGITFVGLGFRVMGALGAYIASNLTILILSFVPLRRLLLEKFSLSTGSTEVTESAGSSDKINFSEVYQYFLPVAITLLCLMVLTNFDIILVKHFFAPVEAGYYSYAQLVGKIILFLPGPITIVMFPKVANLYAQNKDTRAIIKKSLVMVGLLCGIGALLCTHFRVLIIRILAREEYLESIKLIGLFTVTMTFFALLYTLLFYQLSIHRLSFIYPLIFFTVLQTVLIILFHQSLSQVLYILCGNSMLLFVINLRLIKSPER